MSQGAYNVPTGGTFSMVTFAGLMNTAYNALATQSSGSSAPANGPSSAPQEFQTWFDTTNVNLPVLRIFDGVNWNRVGTLDVVGSNWFPQLGGGLATLTSAATVNLGASPQTFITISGTATITSFGAAAKNGEMKLCYASGAFTIQNSSNIVCPDGNNIVAAAGDSFFAAYNGAGQWVIVSYTRASTKDIVFNVEDFGAKGDNSTVNTTAITNAMTAAALLGGSVYFPAGIYITDQLTVPALLPRMFGTSRGGAILKFVRRSYALNSALIAVTSNTANFQIDNLSIDVNNVLFVNTRTIVVSGTPNMLVADVLFTGEAAIGVYVQGGDNVVLRSLAFSGFNDGFAVCVQGDTTVGTLTRMRVEDSIFFGVLGYGVNISGCDAASITNCRSKGNAGAVFAFVLNLCTSSMISGCHAIDSNHEAINLTDCLNCSVIGNTCEWTTSGIDFGISINGTSNQARFNIIANNTILNAFKAGIALADWSQYTVVSGNSLRNCGVRGTTGGGSGGAITQLAAYTVTAAAQCIGNQFRNNICVSESGTTTNGFQENNGGGGGSLVDNNYSVGNYFAGVTTTFLLSGSNSEFFSDLWLTYTPTISSGSGTITSSVVNSASYRQLGKSIEIQLDISITNAGTGAGALIATLPVNASTNGGALSGRDVGGFGKTLGGACSGSQIQLFNADVTTPVVTNNRLVVSGVYHTN